MGELRVNWRALSAAALGLGSGLLLNSYITSIFAPHLLREFGWTKAQFALLGTAPLILLVCLPVVGRLTDLFGVRRVATIGVLTWPLSFIVLSLFDGGLHEFVAIYFLQLILATTTSTTVYSRLVAERFTQARGLAFAIAACGPAMLGAVGAPFLSALIDSHGWRAGYQALAALTAIAGLVVLVLIPPSTVSGSRPIKTPRRAAKDFPLIVRSTAFWLIGIAMFLCNLPQTLHSNQMQLVLLDNGASSTVASMMISIYAVGVMIGRFLCGIALDRMPTHLVAAVCMGLPSLGLFLIASSFDAPLTLAFAMLLIGFSQGAEGDVLAYVVTRFFALEIYSSVLGLLTAFLGAATAGGALLLSLTLNFTETFTLFVLLGAVATLLGSGLFLLLGRMSATQSAVQGPETQAA